MITDASYQGGYKILVSFDDNTTRLADFYAFLSQSQSPHVRKYLDLDLFKRFYFNQWGLCWGDNEFDINPIDIQNGVFDAVR